MEELKEKKKKRLEKEKNEEERRKIKKAFINNATKNFKQNNWGTPKNASKWRNFKR